MVAQAPHNLLSSLLYSKEKKFAYRIYFLCVCAAAYNRTGQKLRLILSQAERLAETRRNLREEREKGCKKKRSQLRVREAMSSSPEVQMENGFLLVHF